MKIVGAVIHESSIQRLNAKTFNDTSRVYQLLAMLRHLVCSEAGLKKKQV
jgi:hypothetical protein